MSVETEVKEVAAEVQAEVKKAEAGVEGAVATAEEKVAEAVKRVRVEVSTEEQLFLRNVEAEYLRAQVQIRDVQAQLKDFVTKSEAASKRYADKLEELVKKYGVDKTEMFFDSLENVFKAAAKKL
jgi:hypothetical protein